MSNFGTPPSGRTLLKSKDGVYLSDTFDAERVTVERIDLKHWYPERETTYALVLHKILTKEECDAIIAHAEKLGFEAALLNTGGGREIAAPDVRNNDRTYIDDDTLAEQIWNRIQTVLSPEREPQLHHRMDRHHRSWRAVGINERLRVLRYDPGTYFAMHFDGAYERTDITHPQFGDLSFVTTQMYLNEGFTGGSTTFLDPGQASLEDSCGRIECVPKTGSVLLFEHRLLHEGSVLEKGRKYTIRSDIMYTREGGIG